MVDTISGLGSADYRHDEWGVDVTISGSQKGLMLPPGLGFNAVSKKAVEASRHAKLTRSYWDWQSQLANNPSGNFPYTPATNLLYGLAEACDMLMDEGLDNVLPAMNDMRRQLVAPLKHGVWRYNAQSRVNIARCLQAL